ncbi:MAG: class I SAM-dependent methyltransferase [Clostridiales bacterium]|jgi:23S rRNA (cytosine1962-C5)-methyltransferase|nr:class I SAM-dependent methyltransferase [Clostridiales bacterium]
MILADGWKDFELIDSGGGEKLERWGAFVLRRPDPQAVWPADKSCAQWRGADAVYHRSATGGGSWERLRAVPDRWPVGYRNLRFYVQLMQFKHTGVFPEQAANWDWAAPMIAAEAASRAKARPAAEAARAPVRVLNLFAYTGGATAAAAAAGASVTHVDASRGMVLKAKDNQALSGVPHGRVRYIVDDAVKFVRREIRRGNRYDAVIMDPPAYGRGPGGELWKSETGLYDLAELCVSALSGEPLFFLINSYATGLSPSSIGNILSVAAGGRLGGRVECGEIGLMATERGIALPCGCFARWEAGHRDCI